MFHMFLILKKGCDFGFWFFMTRGTTHHQNSRKEAMGAGIDHEQLNILFSFPLKSLLFRTVLSRPEKSVALPIALSE